MLTCYDCLKARECKPERMTEPACDRFQPKGVNQNACNERKETRNEEAGKEDRD